MTPSAHLSAKPTPPCDEPICEPHEAVLENVELGDDAHHVTLRSGRRFELEAGARVDHIVVRSASGRVLLRVAVGDDGPLLCFDSAEIRLAARHRLTLAAPEVNVETSTLNVHADTQQTHVRGDRHTRIDGEERLEASAVAIQSNERDVRLRAMQRVALDGDHIGLNDDPCPAPFPWSSLGDEQEESR